MSMHGNLKDTTVADLIQYICQHHRKAQLSIVQHNGRQVALYFKDGNLVHAVLGNQEGEEVVYHILNWEEGIFKLDTDVEQPPAITITRSWTGLLLEGARRIDEEKQDADLQQTNQDLQRKDNLMNIKRLNQSVEELKEDLGTALIATDIWNTDDAQSLAGFNTQPKATALFNEITRNLNKTLKGADFPGLGKYYMLHLENNFMVIVVHHGTFQQGMLVDLSKTTMGILMNIALPKVTEGLAEGTK